MRRFTAIDVNQQIRSYEQHLRARREMQEELYRRAHYEAYLRAYQYNPCEELTNFSEQIIQLPDTEEALFSMLVKGEIDDETYRAHLPKVKLNKKEKLLQQAKNKPKIKQKLKGRLKSWE